jgi:hypothetical protein
LQKDAQENASPKMESSWVAAESQVMERVPLVMRSLDHGLELPDFFDKAYVIMSKITTHFSQNLNCFFAAAIGDEPPRWVGYEVDYADNDENGPAPNISNNSEDQQALLWELLLTLS